MPTPNTLAAYVPDPASALETYAEVNWHRSTTPHIASDGTFGTEVAAETLAEGQRHYTDVDDDGTDAHWYRWRLHHDTGPENSSWSPPFRGSQVSLLTIVKEAARISSNGWSGTCSAASEDSHILYDEVLRDSSEDVQFADGAWVYLENAADADLLRRAVEFYPPSGGIRVGRAWGSGPASTDPYACFLMLAPFEHPAAGYTWSDAVRDAMRAMTFPDELDIGALNSDLSTRYDLSGYQSHIRSPHDVHRVLIRATADDGTVEDIDGHKNGRYWNVYAQGRAGLYLDLNGCPYSGDNLTVVLQVDRNWVVPYGAGDLTDCPLDLAARGAVWKAYAHMNEIRSGKYQQELVHAFQRFKEEAAHWRVRLTGFTA